MAKQIEIPNLKRKFEKLTVTLDDSNQSDSPKTPRRLTDIDFSESRKKTSISLASLSNMKLTTSNDEIDSELVKKLENNSISSNPNSNSSNTNSNLKTYMNEVDSELMSLRAQSTPRRVVAVRPKGFRSTLSQSAPDRLGSSISFEKMIESINANKSEERNI